MTSLAWIRGPEILIKPLRNQGLLLISVKDVIYASETKITYLTQQITVPDSLVALSEFQEHLSKP